MRLIDAILRVYPQASPLGPDYGTSDDGLTITNWNVAKLGPKPNEAALLSQAATLQASDYEKRGRDPVLVYQDINALTAGQQNQLVRAICAVWITQNPKAAKAILQTLNINIPGDETVP
jgi:hypothetical protein